MDQRERSRNLESAIGEIEKAHGKGSILRLGSRDAIVPVTVIPTGSLAVDAALGVGGFPRGRVVEIYGPESSGKTTLALSTVAQAQRLGGVAAFIDAEHAMDPIYAGKLGVDVDNLLVSQPDSGEQALQIADVLVRSGAIDILVVDSVAALVPRAELEGEMGDSHVGLQARLMSQALRKLTATISRTRTSMIFINQLREKVGIVFGNPEVTPGGRALKFYSSVRIEIRRVESLKQGQVVVGNRVRAKVVKNKVAPPFRQAEFDIMFTGTKHGISREGDIIDLGSDLGIVRKMGAFYSYGELRLGQGRENARTFLAENPDTAAEIEKEIRAQAGVATPAALGGARPSLEDDEEEPE
jgi:recombination protein RecA